MIKAETHTRFSLAPSTAPTHILIHQHRHNPKERSHSHSRDDLSFLLWRPWGNADATSFWKNNEKQYMWDLPSAGLKHSYLKKRIAKPPCKKKLLGRNYATPSSTTIWKQHRPGKPRALCEYKKGLNIETCLGSQDDTTKACSKGTLQQVESGELQAGELRWRATLTPSVCMLLQLTDKPIPQATKQQGIQTALTHIYSLAGPSHTDRAAWWGGHCSPAPFPTPEVILQGKYKHVRRFIFPRCFYS